MSFLLTDCKELDFGELLAVNGGCAGGGSCGGGYSGGGGSPRGSSSNYSRNVGISSISGGCSGGSRVSFSGGCAGGSQGLDATTLKKAYDDPENQKKREDASKKWMEKYGEDEAVSKIKKAIDDFGDGSAGDGERKKAYKVGKFQCDDYVEKMLADAGYDPKDYYVDNPSKKTVDTHISELKASGSDNYSTDVSNLGDGAYVVFMKDTDGSLDSHTSIMVVDADGGSYMYDNSSHNFPDRDKDGNIIRDKNQKIVSFDGGVERTGWNNSTAKDICGQYVGYEEFYFKRIN
ncbi:MAG: hypothetical protein K5829_00090 [Treponema sp.]|nr:hypothetical protein [Treponema sp.]